jgi:hypothetical protein
MKKLLALLILAAVPVAAQVFNPTATANPTTILVTDAPYNAKCDGTTDDTAAFTAAFNFVSNYVGYTISLPPVSDFSHFGCVYSSPLAFPWDTVFDMKQNAMIYTGATNNAVAFTFSGADYVFNPGIFYHQTHATGITEVRAQYFNVLDGIQILSKPSFRWSNGTVCLQIDSDFQTSIRNAYTGCPIKIVGNVGGSQPVAFDISNSYINDQEGDPGIVTDNPVIVSGFDWGVLNISNSVIYHYKAADATSCLICVTNTTGPTPGTINLDGVQITTAAGYTGYVLSSTNSGSGATNQFAGTLNLARYTGTNLFTGTWGGTLAFGGTTYRGSAALLTYRCNGGTQAGLIYTNNSSCTGGTAVATGDSVQ